jgi:hypothetical protein
MAAIPPLIYTENTSKSLVYFLTSVTKQNTWHTVDTK